MPAISRRKFFGKSAAGAAAAGLISASVGGLRANPMGVPIGSQTYPHRQRIKDGDLAGLCKDLADLGVGNLELCSPAYGEFASLTDGKQTRKIIEDHGLKCISAHFELSELSNKQDQAIAWAKDIGMTQMGTASLNGRTQQGVATMDVVKQAADNYNKIGENAAKAGITQFLHDENFEMAHVDQADGRLVYQVLFELLDPRYVKFQFQMSAMTTVGDPVMYFTKYPGRFISMHLQGVNLNPQPAAAPPTPAPAAGAAPGQGAGRGRGGGRGGPQLAVGKDSVDWPKVFAAAKTCGVKNYFVEQAWDLTVQSVAYLKTLNV
jgi:sugar phosphate isomerase/epimerase